jgi:hypothetical protein
MLFGFLNGMLLLWITDPDSFSPEESAEAIIDAFLRGLFSR